MRRVEQKVSLDLARERLAAYREKNGAGPFKAATLADVIWPGARWIKSQGAGAAATRVLKRLGCRWDGRDRVNWGWLL